MSRDAQHERPQASAAGGAADWGALWGAHRAELTAYALALTGDPHRAEELIQMVFVRVIRSRVAPKRPLAYLLRALRHASVDDARQDDAARRARARVSSAWLAREGHPGEPVGELRRALEGLTDEQREVVVLRTRTGLGLEAIGEVLGRPAGTVASQYARAIARLRSALGPDGVPDAPLTDHGSPHHG